MIKVNGKEQDFVADMTIGELLDRMGYARNRVAVEKNGLIVPRAQFDEAGVDEEDVIEVLSFVGGG